MTNKTHLDEIVAKTTKPLSRKLVETFRDSVRDPNVAKADYVQRLKNEMEASLQQDETNAAPQPDRP